MAHWADSSLDERSWYVIHADAGPILLFLRYRRPDIGEVASVQRFDAEPAFEQQLKQALAEAEGARQAVDNWKDLAKYWEDSC